MLNNEANATTGIIPRYWQASAEITPKAESATERVMVVGNSGSQGSVTILVYVFGVEMVRPVLEAPPVSHDFAGLV